MAQKECPICNKVVDEKVIQVCQDAEAWIIQSIKRSHPNWVSEDGTCPKCLEYYKNIGEGKCL